MSKPDMINYTLTTGNTEITSFHIQNILEDHIDHLKKNQVAVTVTPKESHVYRRNFYGLLQEKNIPPVLWWITLRLNGYDNPSQYEEGTYIVFVPDDREVSGIVSDARYLVQ